MPREFNRADRVASVLQRELALLLRDAVKDPRVQGVSISEVEVSRDLSHARVYVLLAQDCDKTEVLAALNQAAGFLRAQLKPMLKLRTIPQLKFLEDDSVDRGSRIDALLAQLNKPEY